MRYAAIDRNSGYVWGVADATDAISAAILIQEIGDCARYGAEIVSRSDADASLDLYEIAADVEILDGQDQAAIHQVESGRYVATVRTWDVASV